MFGLVFGRKSRACAFASQVFVSQVFVSQVFVSQVFASQVFASQVPLPHRRQLGSHPEQPDPTRFGLQRQCVRGCFQRREARQ
jgi:hypothetical protein